MSFLKPDRKIFKDGIRYFPMVILGLLVLYLWFGLEIPFKYNLEFGVIRYRHILGLFLIWFMYWIHPKNKRWF